MFLEIDEGGVISSHINQEIEVGSMIFVTSTTESWFGYKNMDAPFTIHLKMFPHFLFLNIT